MSCLAAIIVLTLSSSAQPAFAEQTEPSEDMFQLSESARTYGRDLASWRAARQHYEQAVADVVRQRQIAGDEYRASGEYKAALKAVDDSSRAYNERQKQVVEDIRQRDPRYAELKRQADTVAAQISAARGDAGMSVQQFNDLYNRKAVFTREIKALEDDAMNKANASSLRQQWDEASRRLDEMQSKQRQAIESSDRVKAAMTRVNDARAALDTASAALAGSQSAYAQASAQASAEQSAAEEYLRRYPPYNAQWGNYGWWYATGTNIVGGAHPGAPGATK